MNIWMRSFLSIILLAMIFAPTTLAEGKKDTDTAIIRSLEQLQDFDINKEELYTSEYIHREKIIFRILLENNLQNGELSREKINQLANERVDNLKEIEKSAKEENGITVSEEEVDTYITENIASHQSEDQILYAQKLGLTVEELNFQFDRDLYYFDVLYGEIAESDVQLESNEEEEEKAVGKPFSLSSFLPFVIGILLIIGFISARRKR